MIFASPVPLPPADLMWVVREDYRGPYRCPVCEGRGQVDAAFYSPFAAAGLSTTVPMMQPCRSCGGRGVLWRER